VGRSIEVEVQTGEVDERRAGVEYQRIQPVGLQAGFKAGKALLCHGILPDKLYLSSLKDRNRLEIIDPRQYPYGVCGVLVHVINHRLRR